MAITRRQLAARTAAGLLAAPLLPMPWIRRAEAAQRTVTFAAYGGIFQENYTAAVVEPFMKKHPDIKVTYFNLGSSAQVLGTLRAQKASPQVDVAVLDVSVAKAGTTEGLFRQLDPAQVPALEQLSKRALQPGVDGAALTFDNLVLLYSPSKVKPAPTSWKVLWDKAYAGQIAIPGVPDIVGIGLVLIANEMAGGDYHKSVEPGIESVAKMAPDVLTWEPRPDPYTFIIDGQAALGVGWNARGQLYSQKSGGKLDVLLPSEGSLFQINMIEAVKNSPQPEAALTFVDYVLSPEAQTAFTDRMFYAPTNSQATPSPQALARTAATPQRMQQMLDVDWMAIAKMRAHIGQEWRRKVLTAH